MREFETTFILQPEITDEGATAFTKRLDAIFERGGAIRLLYDDDGKRRLAYEIENFQKGHYITAHYLDDGSVVPELERALRFDESVLRFLTVRVADEVDDVEERRKAAAEEEEVRAKRAAERAAREAEEAKARAEAEAQAATAAAEEAERRADQAAEAGAEGGEGAEDEDSEALARDGGEE